MQQLLLTTELLKCHVESLAELANRRSRRAKLRVIASITAGATAVGALLIFQLGTHALPIGVALALLAFALAIAVILHTNDESRAASSRIGDIRRQLGVVRAEIANSDISPEAFADIRKVFDAAITVLPQAPHLAEHSKRARAFRSR